MRARAPQGIAKHASSGRASLAIAGGALIALGSLGGLALGNGTGALQGLGFGALCLWFGLYLRSSGEAAQVVNRALNAAQAGALGEAEELLDYAERRFRSSYIQRVIHLQRGWVAMRRGDLERALGHADAAVAQKLGFLLRAHARVHVAAAHAFRAVVRASLGDEVGASADVREVRTGDAADPSALARASLAEALLLERAGNHPALAALLRRDRRLLVEHTHPRERAIVRAFQRMLEAKASTVYRNAAAREAAPREEPMLSDWVARIAPGAASFVPAERQRSHVDGEAPVLEAPTVDPAARKAAQARHAKGPRRRVWTVLGLWALLVVMFMAIWQFLAPDGRAPQSYVPETPPASSFAEWILPALTMLGVGAVVAFAVARGRRQVRELRQALAMIARGDEEPAGVTLTALSKSRYAVIAAQALLARAVEMERRGGLEGALRLCDEGLARGLAVAATASDLLLPGLVAERAFLLAALGRSKEAGAEIALLGEKYSSYAFLDAARFRVALLGKARVGDLSGAARVAEQSEDLPITARDELLADLVRAADAPGAQGQGELERLRKELRGDEVSRRWMETVAPGVLAAFHRAEPSAEPGEAANEARAEEEALAELEAEKAIARASR